MVMQPLADTIMSATMQERNASGRYHLLRNVVNPSTYGRLRSGFILCTTPVLVYGLDTAFSIGEE